MFKHTLDFWAHRQITDDLMVFQNGLQGQAPTLAQQTTIQQFQEAAAAIARRVNQSYQKAVTAIQKLDESIGQVFGKHAGPISYFAALAAELFNGVRRVNLVLDYPNNQMARLNVA